MSEANVGTEIPGEEFIEDLDSEQDTVISTDVDPEEEKAREHGWVPQDEWDDSRGTWVDAGEFNRRGDLFAKIDSYKHRLNEYDKKFELVNEHLKKMEERAKEEALKILREEKAEALAAENYDKVVELDEKIHDERNKKSEFDNPQMQGPPPEFIEWNQKNDWYGKNNELTMYADDIGESYKRRNPQASYEQILDYVETMTKKTYSEEFGGSKRSPRQAVESGQNSSSKKTSGKKSVYTEADLSPIQRDAMRTFASQGIMSEEDYIQSLVDMGELGQKK